MSGTSDKAKGYANEVAGSVKKTVGDVVGNDRLVVEGEVQKIKCEGQVAVGNAKDAVKDGANKVADAINRKL